MKITTQLELEYSNNPISKRKEYYKKKFNLEDWVFREPLPLNPSTKIDPDFDKLFQQDNNIKNALNL